MSQEKEQTFTVFMEDGCQGNEEGQDEFAGVGLQELIDGCARRWPSTPPKSWAAKSAYGEASLLHAESIAAGRVIKLIDGRYVPFGFDAPPEEFKPTPSLGDLLRQALERNKQAPADPNAAMIARDGKAKPAPAVVAAQPASTAKPPIAGLTLSPDLRDSGHQVSPGFGSAFLLR